MLREIKGEVRVIKEKIGMKRERRIK